MWIQRKAIAMTPESVLLLGSMIVLDENPNSMLPSYDHLEDPGNARVWIIEVLDN